jgi:ketosteroid isomerase-like protein
MSRENVERIRALYESLAADGSIDEFVTDDFEYVNPPDAVEPGTRDGRASFRAVLDIYPDFRVEPETFYDLGDDVLVIGTAHGTGASGLEIHSRMGFLWTLKDGRAVRFEWFTNPDTAREATGVNR